MQINALRAELIQVSDAATMEEVGIYVKQYKYDVPEEVKAKLDLNAGQQKDMIRQKVACTYPIEWQVQRSVEKGKKMINDKINLMLRALNGECDADIVKVPFSNLATMEVRVFKTFTALNKLGKTNHASLSRRSLNCDCRNCRLSRTSKLKRPIVSYSVNRRRWWLRERRHSVRSRKRRRTLNATKH